VKPVRRVFWRKWPGYSCYLGVVLRFYVCSAEVGSEAKGWSDGELHTKEVQAGNMLTALSIEL
jgi:hypothetical protein